VYASRLKSMSLQSIDWLINEKKPANLYAQIKRFDLSCPPEHGVIY
jgi:hypothetical protein